MIAFLSGALFLKSTNISSRMFVRSLFYSVRASFYSRSIGDDEYESTGDYGDDFLDEDEDIQANELYLDELDDEDENEVLENGEVSFGIIEYSEKNENPPWGFVFKISWLSLQIGLWQSLQNGAATRSVAPRAGYNWRQN